MKVRLAIAVLLSCLAAGSPSSAQVLKLSVAKKGTSDFTIAADIRGETAMNISSALAEQTGFHIKVADPEVTAVLESQSMDVNLPSSDLGEFVDLIGMACGLRVDIDRDKREIRISHLPSPEDPDSAEYFRTKSLNAVVTAYAGDSSPDNEVEFLLRTARLHVLGGRMAEAYSAYENFTKTYSGHSRYPEATLAAAEAAVKAGLSDKALARVADFIKDLPDHRDLGKALTLGALARLQREDVRGATALFKSVIAKYRERSIPERDGLVAEFYLAELLYRNGDYAEAIKLLQELEWRHSVKNNRDLLDQLWLYLAICRNAMGNKRDALHDLTLAVYTNASPKVRIRTLLLSARLYLEVENPFYALNAARIAVSLEAAGRQLFDALCLQGRALRALFLHEKAQKALLDAVLRSPELLPDGEERRIATTEALREVAEDLFDAGNYREALRTFNSIHDAAVARKQVKNEDFGDELIAEMKYMVARCQKRLGQFKEALDTLDGIASGVGDEQFVKDLRQLRGDCFMNLKMYERAIRVWNEGDQG